MSRTVVVSNRFGELAARVPVICQTRLYEAATELRSQLREGLGDGSLPIQADTGALSESLSIQTKSRAGETSDVVERIAAAAEAYVTNPTKYDPKLQTVANFERAVAEPEELPDAGAGAVAAVLTLLVWGWAWENGHYNLFTRTEEHRPWMFPVASRFEAQLGGHYLELFKE